MLRGEDWYMVRDLLRSGVSLSEISRRTGFDRKTIRKLRDQPAHPPPLRRTRRRQIDPYAAHLTARAERGVLNATKLYAEIQQQGYPGGVAQVRRFVSSLRPRASVAVVTRFETLPGQQAQVDWSHCGALGPETDRHTLSAFVLTLGYSRRQYIEFTRSQDLETFLRCHVHAFAYFGGVLAELLYDNLKTAVDHRTPAGGIVWNSRFRDLADSYGFTPRACQPYRPQTKGKVERSIGYLKGNFLLGRELATDTLATLNRDVLLWLRETADLRVHGTIQERPCDRWPAEQAALQPLGSRPVFDTSVISQRLVSRDATVAYKGGSYRVAVAYVGRVVVVKESEDGRVRLYSEGHCIGDLPLQQPRRPLPFLPRSQRNLAPPPPAIGADVGSRLPWPEVERRALAAYDAAAGGED
jgi:transposase